MAPDSGYNWGPGVYYWYFLVSSSSSSSTDVPNCVLMLSRFGWTGFTSSIHWMVPMVAGISIGFGVLCIFLPCFNYLVDSYLPL